MRSAVERQAGSSDAEGPLEALASGELLRTVFAAASVGVKLVDVGTGLLVSSNPALEQLLGYTAGELRSRPFVEFTHPDDAALEEEYHREMLQGERTSFQLVKRFVREDGSPLWARVTSSIVPGADGKPRFALAMVEDATREREADEARRVAEERYRLIVETTSEGIWLVDAEGRTSFANEALARMLGYSVEEMAGMAVYDVVGEDGVPDARRRLERRRSGVSERMEVRFRHASGRPVETLVSGTPLFDEEGHYVGALAVVTDISELRRSQEALAARVRQLEAVAELGRDVIANVSLGEFLDRACRAVADALDVDFVTVLERLPDGRLAMVAGAGWEEGLVGHLVLPAGEGQAAYHLAVGQPKLFVEDLEAERRFAAEFLLDHGARSGLGVRIDGPDGPDGPFGVLAAHDRERRAFSDDDANFLDSVATLVAGLLARDRSSALRQEAEDELRSTAERFRMLAENAQDIVFRYRLGDDPGFEYVSPAIERITGYPAERFYEDPGFSLTHAHPDDQDNVLSERSHDGMEDGPVVGRWRHPDGRIVWLERRMTYVADDEGRLVAAEGIVRDVTDRVVEEERRRAVEEQLHQALKLEAIGQLAGGVAHDFNNLLLAIRGHGEVALRRLGDGDAAEDVEAMLAAADRAADLTRQLLAFGRRQVLQQELLRLDDVVGEMVKLLRRLIGENIQLVTVWPDEPVLVEADRAQVEQVIVNLAVNARDAMPDGGQLAIEVGTDEAAGGRCAVITVRDSGVGMDAETAARIFEPFFTTKGEGGTGLGLATVHGIVTQSGGHIAVESEPGLGTTFTITLPLGSGTLAEPVAAPSAAAGGKETILLVEDDPMVRSVVRTMLEDRGYRILAAESGEEAIAVLERSHERVDLLLSDLVMGGLDGRQTAERVRELRPDVRVLFMSGYTDDIVIRSGSPAPGTAFVQKPFSGDELARRVRELLDVRTA